MFTVQQALPLQSLPIENVIFQEVALVWPSSSFIGSVGTSFKPIRILANTWACQKLAQ